MNTRTKTIIGILLALVIAFGAYRTVNRQTKTDVVNTGSTTVSFTVSNDSATSTLPSKGKLSFGEFLKQGGTYVCTFNGAMSATTTTKGTVYASGGRIRGDVTVTNKTESGTASFMAKDGYVYYWNSAMPAGQGIKIKYDMASYKPGDFDQFDKAGAYDCKPWTAEASKFALPTSIRFQEVK